MKISFRGIEYVKTDRGTRLFMTGEILGGGVQNAIAYIGYNYDLYLADTTKKMDENLLRRFTVEALIGELARRYKEKEFR